MPFGKKVQAEFLGVSIHSTFSEHFLVGVTDRDRSGQLEPQVFVMDMSTGRANSFAKARRLNQNGMIDDFAIGP